MLGLVLALSLTAWILLALGLPRHHKAVFGTDPAPARRRLLRAAGWCLLPLGFAVAAADRGWGQGPIFWAASLVIAALAWVLLMTLWPRRSWAVAVPISLLLAATALV
ncbi:DUF3325 domain-containing protein [Marilutibacter chinensis]|uniref:DUF3325 domain-containing protein n=1 Tax=Marilutibacter chinensis TaxID=2912247 RepID=A0ABS9HQW1_9GAMM|nr:DUF3325 domain-containing protein [Lysobacter chinensis]MCF7220692.1 DUF3325 domain-containing protein [Lysobacter chinensis]